MIYTLEADGIQVTYGLRRLLSDVYIKCSTGETVVLLGRNGEGKSTLLNIIAGSREAEEKSIRINGIRRTFGFRERRSVNFLPQHSFLPGFLSLERVFANFNVSYSSFAQEFPAFAGREKTRVRGLSGGEKRTAEVYLVVKAPALFSLLDEPFSQLSPLYIEKIQAIIEEEKQHKGFILTDQMYEYASSSCERIYLLFNGRMRLIRKDSDLEDMGYLPTRPYR